MSTYANARPEMESGAFTLPASYYTDPAFFAREMEAIHYSMWLWAGRTEQIPNPGSYFVRDFAKASVIVLRDENGEVSAFHNVCRHRGTRLCKGDAGALRRAHPVLVSRLDLRSRRQARQRTAHGEGAGLPRSEPPPGAGGHGGVGWPHLHQPRHPSPALCRTPRGPRLEVPALGNGGPEARGAADLPVEGQLEARHPELLGVPALPDRPPRC